MESITTNTFTLAYDEELIIQKAKQTRPSTPNYIKTGSGTMNKHGIDSIDFIEELTHSTVTELFVIREIRRALVWANPDGEVRLLMRDYSTGDQKKFNRGYKLLAARELVIRTKRSHYMINPKALISFDYKQGADLWQSVITNK